MDQQREGGGGWSIMGGVGEGSDVAEKGEGMSGGRDREDRVKGWLKREKGLGGSMGQEGRM